MFQLFMILLFIIGSGYTIAKNAADSFVSTNLNAILLMCPNATNKDWSCVPQLIININFTPNLNVDSVDKLLILDETYEPTKRRTLRIMSPYIIVVTRSEPIMMFPLLSSNNTNNKHFSNMNRNPIESWNGNNNNYTYHTQKILKKTRRRSSNAIINDICAKIFKHKRENPYIISNSSVRPSINENHQNCGSNSKGNPRICNSLSIFSALKPTDKQPEYSTYNLNAPFPYLAAKIRIFRKRKQTWWRIMPIISLNNLSGTFVNGNISVLLTSHEDILHKRMPLLLENYKILIPNNFFTNPKQLDGLRIYKSIFLEFLKNNTNNYLHFDYNKKSMKSDGRQELLTYKPKIQQNSRNGAGNLIDPTFVNILSKCPNNDKALCLNVLDDQVPAFDIKIKMPFLENGAQQNIFRVKISRIVTDATTKDALQISVDVISKGLKAQEFLISICDCPIFESQTESATAVNKILLPHISETITFLLPFIMRSKKKSKFTCDVTVEAYKLKNSKPLGTNKSAPSESNIVSRRSMDIETHSRCFCIWNCRCHCIGKIETHSDTSVCQKMGYAAQKDAGLLLNCPSNDDLNDLCSIDLSNETSNNYSSFDLIIKIVEVILILLIVFLLVLYCCKCFKPRKEDLIVASTEWFCCPQNNLITCSRYNILRKQSRSSWPSSYSNKYFTKTDAVPSPNVSISSSVEISSKKSNQTDLLESALVTLARQQKELRKQSLKKEW